MAAATGADSEQAVDWSDELLTGEAVALDLRPVPFVLRAAGCAIDTIVYVGSYLLILVAVLTAAGSNLVSGAVAGIIGISALVVAIVIVPTVVETASRGKSLGRLVVGSRIVRDDGGAIGLRHAAIRALVGMLEIVMTFGGIAAISGLLNRRSKRLGDLVAGTYAQYERVSRTPAPVFGIPVELETWAVTADVGRLPVRLSRRVAQFLAQAPQMAPASRQLLARELANETSAFVSPVPAADPELFLAAVSVLRREREATGLELERRARERLAPSLDALPHRFPHRG